MSPPVPLPALACLLTTLYIAQGLPSGFFAHALPALLREHGVSLTWISLARLLAMPWFFKFLWAPWVDQLGSQRFGHYRSWILPLQSCACLLLLGVSLLAPEQWFATHLPLFLLAVLLTNALLATQDVATDALAVKLLPVSLRSIGNGIQVAGYKLGMLAGGNGLLMLTAVVGLQQGLRGLAVALLLLMIPVLLFREPRQPSAVSPSPRGKAVSPAWSGWRQLLQQPGMYLWLPVLLSYKVADSLASPMIKPAMVDAGLSLAQIGQVSLLASVAGMVAAFAGGLLARRLGGFRALFWFGCLQSVGLALWMLLPLGWNSQTAVLGIAMFEQVVDAMSTVALFAGMMGFCRSGHEGGDYTLQMSLFMLVSGTLSLAGGFLAERLGLPLFFALSGVLGLCCLAWVWRAQQRTVTGSH